MTNAQPPPLPVAGLPLPRSAELLGRLPDGSPADGNPPEPALAAGADAELAWQTVVDVKCHMDRVCHLTLQDRTSMLGIISQHETIVAAIDARDAEAADKAMRHHLTEILRALPQVLTDRADLFE